LLGGTKLGKVKTEQIKRVAKELIRRFPDKFSNNFEKNKHTVDTFTQGTTIKVRNQIAGYITRFYSETPPESPDDTASQDAKT
jgi:small subunit ribosomal protein S17e